MKHTPTATRLNRKIVLLVTIISVVIINSCQKNLDIDIDIDLYPTISTEITSEYLLNGNLTVYLQNEQIFRHQGKPGVNIIPIGMDNLADYEKCFILNVASSAESAGTVSSAIIKLDEQEVLKTSNFSNKEVLYKFEICNLSKQSVLEVEVRGTPGSYLDIWIEGTLKKLTVTDCDMNVYKTIKIGNQIWMAENLKTTKFNDCTDIPLVTDNTEWNNLITPGYCWYNDSPTYKIAYGALYNWYAVNTGNLCPVGWHVPTVAEWTTLNDYLTTNGYGYDGSGDDIAKSLAATYGWNVSSTPGAPGNDQTSNNSSGFNGLPGGFRNLDDPNFYGLGLGGYWWTSTEEPSTNGASSAYYYRNFLYLFTVLGENLSQGIEKAGLSVRCLKDN